MHAADVFVLPGLFENLLSEASRLRPRAYDGARIAARARQRSSLEAVDGRWDAILREVAHGMG